MGDNEEKNEELVELQKEEKVLLEHGKTPYTW